jgi:hypothetical protein
MYLEISGFSAGMATIRAEFGEYLTTYGSTAVENGRGWVDRNSLANLESMGHRGRPRLAMFQERDSMLIAGPMRLEISGFLADWGMTRPQQLVISTTYGNIVGANGRGWEDRILEARWEFMERRVRLLTATFRERDLTPLVG